MADRKKEMTFEEKLAKMEEIAKKLRDPETDLRKAVDMYEEGMTLAREVDEELTGIERRIEIVTSAPGESSEGVMTEKYKEN